MKILLLKDVLGVGLTGQVKKVSDGYARNFLFPKKIAVLATAGDENKFEKIVKEGKVEKQLAGSRVAALADQLKKTNFILKKTANEQGKLYGAISEDDIVAVLAEKKIQVNRKQIEIPKSIRSTGEYKVIIRLTSKLKPEVKVKIVAA